MANISDFMRLDRRQLLLGAGAGLMATALPGKAFAQPSGEITVWTWAPSMEEALAAYNATNPSVKANVLDPGGGGGLYLKLRNALKAGSGLPDVVQCEFAKLPSFLLVDAFANLSDLGADAYEPDYIPWTWSQVKMNGSVYALPWDIGPMGLMFRQDIVDQYGLTVPTTWADYRTQAEKLRSQTKDVYMSNVLANNAGWLLGMIMQAGARPFAMDGETLTVAINKGAARDVCEFWQSMIDDDLVDTMPGFTTEWFAALDAGRFAFYPSAAWAANAMMRNFRDSMGKWGVSELPQWTEGQPASGAWGGSTFAILKDSPNKEAAFQFISDMSHNEEFARVFTTRALFPTLNSLVEEKAFAETSIPMYGQKNPNEVFIKSAQSVDPSFQWSPFQDFVEAQIQDVFSAAVENKTSLVAALDEVQGELVRFAQDQGFTVNEG